MKSHIPMHQTPSVKLAILTAPLRMENINITAVGPVLYINYWCKGDMSLSVYLYYIV